MVPVIGTLHLHRSQESFSVDIPSIIRTRFLN